MNRIHWTVFLLLALLVPATVCIAADRPCHQPWVYFGNGVWNAPKDAEKSKKILKERLKAYVAGTDLEGTIKYDVSYNPSTGAIRDLLETFLQNFETDISEFRRFLAGLDPMPDALQDRMREILNNRFAIVTTAWC